MHSKSRISGLVCAFLWALPLAGQHFSFQSFSEEQGLRNLSVACLLQDRTGFLWIGTQNGLFRFDGHQFTAFGRDQGLTDTMIYAIHQTPDGVIWAGTLSDLFRYENGRFTRTPGKIPWDVRSPHGLASDRQGRLFVATGKGLVVGQPEAGNRGSRTFQYFAHPRFQPGQAAQAAQAVHVDPDDVLWFSSGGLLYSVQGEQLVAHRDEGLSEHAWTSILTDANGNLWVRGDSHLFMRKKKTSRFVALEAGLPKETRGFLYEDGHGGVLLSSARGLGRWTGSEWKFYDDTNGLPGQSVCCSIEDREGSRWVGLRGAGLVRWRSPDQWESYSRTEGLRSEEVWSIQRDRQGQVWVGTSAGVEMLPGDGTPAPGRKSFRLGDSMVTSMTRGADGTLWAGLFPGGVLRIDPAERSAQKFGKEAGLQSERVLAVFADKSDRLWAGTTAGLFRSVDLASGKTKASPGTTRFERVDVSAGSESEMFHQLAQDSQGVMWVAGRKGLARWRNRSWTRFTSKDGLLGDHVAGVTVTSSDEIWVYYGQDPGVSRLRFNSSGHLSAEHFGRKNGVHSEQVTFVGADHRGGIWVGGDQGIDLFNGANWRYFGRAQGLVWNDCNSNAFFADPDGGVWVGTSKGLAHYRPPDHPPPNPAPPIVLTGARWGMHALSDSKAVAFPFERSPLSISFAALTFTNESAVRFRYRLNGLEQDWVDSDQREVRFPSLAPGAYTFEVLARSAEQVWSESPARVSFQIRPPFWQTWWFTLLIATLCALAAWRTWLWRMRNLLNRQMELERIVDERTQELQAEKKDLLKARAELQELATRDSLTGLWNRRMIFEILANELARGQTERHSVAVIMADLDGFKRINDQHGHMVGDMVLRHAASLLEGCLRRSDAVGRYGGEELLVVLPNCAGEIAAARAEELRRALASHPLQLASGPLTVTASFGVNWTVRGECDSQELVREADTALYRAKQMGRNRVETAQTETLRRCEENTSSATGIRPWANDRI